MCWTHTCRCSNIKIKGVPLPNGVIPNISGMKLNYFKVCNKLSFVHNNSIYVQNNEKIDIRKTGHHCYVLICCACYSAFFLSNYQGKSFAGKIDKQKLSEHKIQCGNGVKHIDYRNQTQFRNSKATNDGARIPEAIKCLFANPNCSVRSNEYNVFSTIDNCDFDIMFRNKTDPTVGSYDSVAISNMSFGI